MTRRSGIQLAYPFEEKRLAKWKPPWFVQPKLDGERCRALLTASQGTTLLSSEQNQISSVPHIKEALNELGKKLGKSIELDGELYTHGLAFEDVHSVVGRTVNLHPLHGSIEYHVFDIVDETLPQIDRIKLLYSVATAFPAKIRMVRTLAVSSLDEIMLHYDDIVNAGYEGIIVRHIEAPYKRKRSTFMMKFKPKKADIYFVVGYKEENDIYGKPKGRLGALSCIGDDGTEFDVGSGLKDTDRQTLWTQRDSLQGHYVKVAYQHTTQGSLRFPVFIELLPKREEPKFENPLL